MSDEVATLRVRRKKSIYGTLRRKTFKKHSTFFDRLVIVVPPLVAEACGYLQKHGLEEEGLFRVTGTMKDIMSLKERYLDKGEVKVNLSQFSLHTIGGLLSAFLQDLDPPLLTFELYDIFIATTGVEPQDLQLRCLKAVINSLPPGNRSVLHCIMNLYHEISLNHKVNKMGHHNLAIAVSPLLIRPELETIETMVEHGHAVQTLISTMIEHYNVLFDKKQMVAKNGFIELPKEAPADIVEMFNNAQEQLKESEKSYNIKGSQVMDFPVSPRESLFPEIKVPKKEEPIAKFQALWRGYSTRKKLQHVNRAYQIVYNRSIWDLMKREINFLWTMNKNIADVESRLLKPNKFSKIQFSNAKLAKSQVHSIISNIKAVMEVHDMILEDVTDEYQQQWPILHDIGKNLLAKTKLFIVYRTYVDMHCHFQRIMATSKDESLLSDLQLILESTSSAYGSRSLKDVINLAFKHISAWKIPLQGLVDTSLTHKVNINDTHNIMQAFAVMTRIGRFFHLLQDWKERELVRNVEEKVVDVSLCLSHNIHRRYLLEGPASVSSQSRYLFLFNDLLVICKVPKKSKQIFKFKYMVDMIGSSIAPHKNHKDGFLVTSGTKAFPIHPKTTDNQKWSEIFHKTAARWNGATFCVPITWILKQEEQTEDTGIPTLVTEIISILKESEAMNEAVLCASNDTFSVSVVRTAIESKESVNWKEHSLETIVGVLKLFCEELPEPLLEWNYCTQFPLFTKQKQPDKEGITEMMLSLSPANHPILLALNWGHHLLRLSNETLDTATDIQWGVNVIKELITNCNTYFTASPGTITNPRRQEMKEFGRGRSLIKLQ